ncbi:DUF3343 domain-containing protein [Bacillota bacterium LX-D]|nr:DUF3343 domain-containing protein [Bacillota bacterium LX-D]
MERQEEYCLYTFTSTSYAIQAERKIKELNASLDAKIIPVPRQISVNCGLAIKFCCEYKKIINDVLLKNKIPFSKLFYCTKLNNNLIFIEG